MVQTVAALTQTNVVNIQIGLCSMFTSTCPETLYFSLTATTMCDHHAVTLSFQSSFSRPSSFLVVSSIFVSVVFAQYLVPTVPILDFVLVTHSLLLLLHHLVIVIMSHSRPLSPLLPFPPQNLHDFSLPPLHFLPLKAQEE